MPLNKDRLKDRLKQVYKSLKNSDLNEESGLDFLCQEMASAIIDEVKELKIIYQSGLAAPNGAVTGQLNHSVT
jgi:hypothetical protein